MNEWLARHRGYLFLVLLNLIAWGGISFMLQRPTAGLVEILPPPTITPAPSPTPVIVTVYVSGAVARPDVYTLPEGSRVQQAIQAAGGFTRDALEAGINLAQPLADGQQVHVPTRDEAPPGAGDTAQLANDSSVVVRTANPASAAPASGRVNINTASAEELVTLPRIGPAMAARIIEYRENHGGFQSIEEIMEVRGIGEATFEQLRELITVR